MFLCVPVGLPPKISFVNGTNAINVTVETKVTMYFSVTSYPPPIFNPQVTFNDLTLPSKWHVVYKTLDLTSLSNVTDSSHFLIEITTERVTFKDEGVYSVTVTNACSSSTKTVTIKGKQDYILV